MSDIERLKAGARKLQEESDRTAHTHHETEAGNGERAARADLDRILREIDKRMSATGPDAWRYKNGDGQYTYSMPDDFKSSAPKLTHQKVLYNGHAFIEAYGKVLKEALGAAVDAEFFVYAHSKLGHATLAITWKPRAPKKKKEGEH